VSQVIKRINSASQLTPSVDIFNVLLKYCKSVSQGEKVISTMQLMGVLPDAVTHNSMLNLEAKQGNFEEALDMAQMMQDRNIADEYSYSALLIAAGKAGLQRELYGCIVAILPEDSTLQVFAAPRWRHSEKESGTNPEVMTGIHRPSCGDVPKIKTILFNSAIRACGLQRDIAAARALFGYLTRHHEPDIFSCKAMLAACTSIRNYNKKKDVVIKVEEELARAGLKPTREMYHLMVVGLAQNGTVPKCMLKIRLRSCFFLLLC